MDETGRPFDDYGYLLELIDFAIRKEVEAAAFYTDLAAQVDSDTVAAELRRLASMEKEHQNRLEKLNVAAASWKVSPRITDVKLADYLVTAEPRPGMSRHELLRIAIGREVASMRLYTDMATALPDSLFKQLLQNLAGEEALHKQYIERLQKEDSAAG